jgi:hypothetical protein
LGIAISWRTIGSSLYRYTAAEIKIRYQQLFEKIAALNPSIQIILTVSPVRHWKHGAANNNWSKAILIDAVAAVDRRECFCSLLSIVRNNDG